MADQTRAVGAASSRDGKSAAKDRGWKPLLRAKAERVDPDEFTRRILEWHDRNGRHDLPWQKGPTPYRVWVSEIMLQQTQVATVIPYYERFMQRFPDIESLAKAPLDDVLHHWSGLGYYARARNLHGAAQTICHEHGGEFPAAFDDVLALRGIGRSTAGAILALARGERHAILDGNVKRVLARFFAVNGWPGKTAVAKELWTHAERLTPTQDVAAYTQAIMDLGATLCTRTQPRCPVCPVRDGCAAFALGNPQGFPGKRPKARERRVRHATFAIICSRHGVLLQRRPPTGIWGGLWSLPEIDEGETLPRWCRRELGVGTASVEPWPGLRHVFTHFDLEIRPVRAELAAEPPRVFDDDDRLWYNGASPASVGLPAPVATLLERLASPADP